MGEAKTLVLAGGGHAHLLSLWRAAELRALGARVVLVSPHRFQYYSGMGPGLLGGAFTPEEVRFDLERIAARFGVEFIRDEVESISPGDNLLRLGSGAPLGYDFVSFNTGSRVDAELLNADADTAVMVKPIVNLRTLRERVLAMGGGTHAEVVVVGGGPAGIEIAGNLWRLGEQAGVAMGVTLVEGADRLAPAMSVKLSERARASLKARGVKVECGVRVERIDEAGVRASGSRRYPADVVVLCTGIVPGALFDKAGLSVEGDPGLAVDEYLKHRRYPNIFAVGDCAYHPHNPLARIGVHAVRQAPVLLANLKASLSGAELKTYRPRQRFLLILNMGDSTGILQWGRLVLGDGWAWSLKRYIDRKFMGRFQV